jgi:translation elongation factor EF-4
MPVKPQPPNVSSATWYDPQMVRCMMAPLQLTDGTGKERGITITSAAVSCKWNFLLLRKAGADTKEYYFNIIDTPVR